ncbi:MAG: phage head-tail adaptor [Verrucomicrobiaceae bacterium]|nr:phage head-tail adaptor [Verrucomicrobiaceae bacterium]
MRAGDLDKRAQIQRRSTAQDDFGQPLETYTDVVTRWIKIEPLSGREFISRSGEAADSTHKITLRPFNGLTPAHRIVYHARIFDIQHVANIAERGVDMILICKERLA